VRRVLAAALATAVVLPLAGCAGQESTSHGPVANVSVHDDDGLNGVVLPKPYDVPDVTLDDTSGRPYDLATDATKPVTLVFFGYTNCPDICQVVMANIASALTRLSADQRAKVGMVFVTTDPARDDARTLHGYLARFNPSFEGLTGDLSRVVALGKAFDVPVEKGQKLPSGGYDVAHGTQVVGLLPDRTAPFVWTEGTDPAALADDLTKILDHKVPGL
jgi:protein SCO1/2